MKCGLLMLVAALIVPALSKAQVTYRFDFSASIFTNGQRVMVSYTTPSATAPGMGITGVTQNPLYNISVSGTRNSSGAWEFFDSGDPHVSYSFTAQTGLTFPNVPGVYRDIPATTVFGCGPICFGPQSGTASGTVDITISGSVNPKALTFMTTLPQVADSQSFAVSTPSPVAFTASASSGSGPAGWLTVFPVEGTTPAGLTVTVSPGLPVGAYSGEITIKSALAAGGVISTIPVTYTVVAGSISVTNDASFVVQISPGSLAAVFGNGNVLAKSTVSDFSAPFSTNSNGTSVTMNGIACPLIYLSPTQINLQVPTELQPGPVAVVVNNNGTSFTTTVPVVAASPGVFVSDFVGTAILQDVNGALLTRSNPAKRGQVVVMYATGIGPVNPPVATGSLAGVPLSTAASAYSVTVNGSPAQVDFVGLTPGFLGLGQINFHIPANAPIGTTIPVILTINGVSAKQVQIGVSAG